MIKGIAMVIISISLLTVLITLGSRNKEPTSPQEIRQELYEFCIMKAINYPKTGRSIDECSKIQVTQ